MSLKNLADVHTSWNTKWVQDNIDWSSIFKEWHIFDRKDLGDNTLVTVATSKLVTILNLALLSNVNTNNLVYTSWKFVIFGVCNCYGNNLA